MRYDITLIDLNPSLWLQQVLYRCRMRWVKDPRWISLKKCRPRNDFGAPISRKRVFILLVKRSLMNDQACDLEATAALMKERLKSTSSVTWPLGFFQFTPASISMHQHNCRKTKCFSCDQQKTAILGKSCCLTHHIHMCGESWTTGLSWQNGVALQSNLANFQLI